MRPGNRWSLPITLAGVYPIEESSTPEQPLSQDKPATVTAAQVLLWIYWLPVVFFAVVLLPIALAEPEYLDPGPMSWVWLGAQVVLTIGLPALAIIVGRRIRFTNVAAVLLCASGFLVASYYLFDFGELEGNAVHEIVLAFLGLLGLPLSASVCLLTPRARAWSNPKRRD